MSVTVRDIAENDFFGWLPLFDEYCAARGARLDDTKALIVWSWIQEPQNPLRAALAVDDDGTPIGLVHYHPVSRTYDASTEVVVDDLYVGDGHRGNGVGRQLIDLVRARAAELHATRLTWANDAGDAEALRLSDEVGRRSTSVVFEADV